MLASKLSIVLQSKSHKYLIKDWDLPRKVDYSVTEKSRKSQNRIAQGVGWKGRECREGRKAFCAPTWELPTEAAWPHLMFYSQSLPTLLQTFKLHFLLELSRAHIHTDLSNRLIPVLCYSEYSSKHRGPDISTTGYGELGVQAQEGNSWVILWFCFEFLRTLQTDAHNGHINLHPQQCIRLVPFSSHLLQH